MGTITMVMETTIIIIITTMAGMDTTHGIRHLFYLVLVITTTHGILGIRLMVDIMAINLTAMAITMDSIITTATTLMAMVIIMGSIITMGITLMATA